MNERGFIHQITDMENLQKEINTGSVAGYIGFDCTAPSLHVGSLIQIMMLRWLQKSGNKPIVLMGGGTTKVGDPSGKDTARPLLSSEKMLLIEIKKINNPKPKCEIILDGLMLLFFRLS